jgi:hypothetical protein
MKAIAKFLRTCGVALALGWFGGAAGAQGHPQPAPDPMNLFAAARPALEEAAGWRLERPPACRLATADELRQLADPEVEAQVRWRFPELDSEARTRAAAAATDAVRQVAVACWIEGQDVLLLLPDNARRIAGWDPSLARADAPEFLQLMLVQETVRARLRQRYDLGRRLASCRDGEEYLALQALVEGRALAVTRAVARRLGTEGYFPLVAERYLHLPDGGTDALVRLVRQETLRQRQRAALQGMAFFDYLDEHGLQQAERSVFARPPRQLDWISHPELYMRARLADRADLAEVLKRLEPALPASAWCVERQPWTPDMVRQAATLFGERERTERVVSRWEEGRGLLWTRKNHPACQVGIGVIRFRDAAAAQAYCGLSADLHRKQDEMLGGDRVLESHARAVTLQGADEAACTEKRLRLTAEAGPVAINEVCARRGETVFQFTWTGLPADPHWAEQVLQFILRDPLR